MQLKTQDCEVLNQPSSHPLKPRTLWLKMLDAIVNALGKHTYLCDNPNYGSLIIYHKNESRPQVCIRCGSKIDWEGKYITRIKACPKCNKEYDSNANYCAFHIPPITLIEKEIEK